MNSKKLAVTAVAVIAVLFCIISTAPAADAAKLLRRVAGAARPPNNTKDCSSIPPSECWGLIYCYLNATQNKCELRPCMPDNTIQECMSDADCFWNSTVPSWDYPCQFNPCYFNFTPSQCSYSQFCEYNYRNDECLLRCDILTERAVCEADVTGRCVWADGRCQRPCEEYSFESCPASRCWIPVNSMECKTRCESYHGAISCAFGDNKYCFYDGSSCTAKCMALYRTAQSPSGQAACRNNNQCALSKNKDYCLNKICDFNSQAECAQNPQFCYWSNSNQQCFIQPCIATNFGECYEIRDLGCVWKGGVCVPRD